MRCALADRTLPLARGERAVRFFPRLAAGFSRVRGLGPSIKDILEHPVSLPSPSEPSSYDNPR
jgi:hypothetical protein